MADQLGLVGEGEGNDRGKDNCLGGEKMPFLAAFSALCASQAVASVAVRQAFCLARAPVHPAASGGPAASRRAATSYGSRACSPVATASAATCSACCVKAATAASLHGSATTSLMSSEFIAVMSQSCVFSGPRFAATP